MMNVISSHCKYNMCHKVALYGLAGQHPGRFCSLHMQPGMMNVVSKLCEEEGCITHASFGVEGTKERRCCALHKLLGMVNVIIKGKRSAKKRVHEP